MKWISVHEQLPELKDRGPNKDKSSDPVLVFNGRISVGIRWIREEYPGLWKDTEYFLSNEEEERNEITHWMPLPSPPEQ